MSDAKQESRRTAFKAAYLMGDQGRELFIWLAGQDLPAARPAAVLSLYLRWRRDRPFVFGLLDDLARDVGLPPFGRRGRVLRFLGDLSITIYINHPDDDEVIRRTSLLWRRVLRGRLRLHRLLFLMRGPILGHIQAIISARTLRTAVLAEIQDPDALFHQSAEARERFLRIVPLVDPGEKVGTDAQRADVAALLESEILIHRVLAALVIAIHAVRDPERMRRFVDDLWRQVGAQGRMWSTLAYAVPLPGTPEAWVEQLEGMTRRLIEEHRATFLGQDDPLLARFDIVLLPLGLAYGKRGGGMPLFQELLERGLHEDPPVAVRVIHGLAAVGVYYPHAVFEVLRVCADDLDRPETAEAFVDAMAAMRALHFDAVDLFLQQVGVPDAIRDRVSKQETSQLVSRCVHWIGYYSNAVHEGLNYPIMRKALLIDALESLGRARRASDFTRAHTPTLLNLLEATDFELIRWTKRDA